MEPINPKRFAVITDIKDPYEIGEDEFVITKAEAQAIERLLHKEHIDVNHHPIAYEVLNRIFTFARL
jgi:hypothetical protein